MYIVWGKIKNLVFWFIRWHNLIDINTLLGFLWWSPKLRNLTIYILPSIFCRSISNVLIAFYLQLKIFHQLWSWKFRNYLLANKLLKAWVCYSPLLRSIIIQWTFYIWFQCTTFCFDCYLQLLSQKTYCFITWVFVYSSNFQWMN